MDQYNKLLQSLHRLYSRVGFLQLQKQLQRYRPGPQGIYQHSISLSLVKHIDRLANTIDSHESSESVLDKSSREIAQKSRDTKHRKLNLSASAAVDMKNFFPKNRGFPGAAANLCESLKKSTWSHMRTALRLAKQGQIHSAKIHANIADQALKEVAHFMSAEEYNNFTEEVKNTLKSL